MSTTVLTPAQVPAIVDNATLLDLYRAVEVQAAGMAAAAREGDWDRVVATEARCATLVAKLRGVAPVAPLSGEDDRQRLRLMARILRHDAVIREARQHASLGRVSALCAAR